jgi:methylenetetrahydrofolate reductase (NADPH)
MPVSATTWALNPQQRQIAGLMRSCSAETTARDTAVDEVIASPLTPNISIYITALPGDRPESIIAAARRLRRAGFNPVPHLGARYFTSQRDLESLLGSLTREAGVFQVLVIGGDIDRARGPFTSGLALLQSGALERAGIRRVGLAAYPEGHPRIRHGVLEDALAAKIEWLRQRGISAYVISQFCFAADPIRDWLCRFSPRFADLPIHVGLAGPAGVSTLVKYGIACGIGASLRALRRNVGFGKLLTETSPTPIIAALVRDHEVCDRIAQLHFFTFGGIRRTAAWLREMTASDGAA